MTLDWLFAAIVLPLFLGLGWWVARNAGKNNAAGW